ncbi:YsnF/AvaK domain-containing protein [Neobacillus drentensis]|uniref:YsnF/AvaK domain-containing protein n=1 Tax=Neobacillus drentensis TaxID=220684 RepID=UPI001F41C692|nr:YsnF/AvaK domain-containing protein [Neobacillus drentensis]ULT57343.1 YsnF/AvaK domain-containing protein [Neobacillus drentensis]
MSKTVLGVYNSSEEVVQAIEEFQNQGYSANDLSIIANTTNVPSSIEEETGVASQEIAATREADTEEHRGFFASLFTPFEDRMYQNDGSGTTYYDHLVAQGINQADALKYQDDLNSGMILLLGERGSGNVGVADDVAGGTLSSGRTDLEDTLDTDSPRSIKLREEQLDVNKQRVQTGEVEVKKDVVEEQQTVNVPVQHEEVSIERRAVDGTEADTTTPIGDDETIRVPIVEEKVEVTKKPVVTEELVINKKQVTETQQVTDNVKREEAKVNREGDVSVNETTTDNERLNPDSF